MSQTSREPPSSPAGSGTDESFARLTAPLPAPAQAPSGAWQGWAYFGGVVMALMGLFWAVLGLVALVSEEYFTVPENSLLVASNYATWGWVHLIGGVAALAAGAGILWGGHRWARIAGVVVAGLSAVVNLGFLGAHPVWAVLMIALDVLVIYALTVHGWEIEQ